MCVISDHALDIRHLRTGGPGQILGSLARDMGTWHRVGAGTGSDADLHAGAYEPVAERCGRPPGCPGLVIRGRPQKRPRQSNVKELCSP